MPRNALDRVVGWFLIVGAMAIVWGVAEIVSALLGPRSGAPARGSIIPTGWAN